MKGRYAGWVLLGVQLALVLSIAGKYWYERETRPMVWARTGQYDPNQPLRGRYLGLRLLVDGCGLPKDKDHSGKHFQPTGKLENQWEWNTKVVAKDGHLVAVLNETAQRRDGVWGEVELWEGRPCERIPMREPVEYFIPEHAPTPFPLKPGQELWVLVTVPESGPPRPVELAVSDAGGWHPLRFE